MKIARMMQIIITMRIINVTTTIRIINMIINIQMIIITKIKKISMMIRMMK